MKFVLLLLLLSHTFSINQTCSLIQPCPQNSDCSPLHNYCICDPGFIANCDQRADPLGQYPYLIELNPYTLQLFYIKPIQHDQSVQIIIKICRQKEKQNVPITLFVWTQNGKNTQYLPTNTLYHPVEISFQSLCRTYTIKFANFDTQPNGESQMLILGLSGNKHKTILSLTAYQKLMQGINFYQYIMVGLIVFAVVLLIVLGATMIMKRRRWMAFFRYRGYIVQNSSNLDHFQIFMPSVAAGKNFQKQTCPICLQNIQPKQQIRNTPCSHVFHTACLDSWCITNLNCPVCRSDFSAEKIAEIGSQSKPKESVQLQDVIQVNLQKKQGEMNMREQMLQ